MNAYLKLAGIVLTLIGTWTLDSVVHRLQNSSTHFVGMFPGNINTINTLIKNTHRRLIIVADYCAYGHFSNPEGYRAYKRAIIDAARVPQTPQIEIYIYTPEEMRNATHREFSPAFWSDLQNSKRFHDYFQGRSHDGITAPDTLDKFFTVMAQEEEQCVTELQNDGIKVMREISHPLALYVWLRDDEEAVLSIYNYGGPIAQEASLSTRDPSLIATLQNIALKSREK
jgi:hypothetical protein